MPLPGKSQRYQDYTIYRIEDKPVRFSFPDENTLIVGVEHYVTTWLNGDEDSQKWIDRMTLSEAKNFLATGTHFAKGSMAPKIQAIIWFLEAGGKQALITNPENIGRALNGETGTWIVPD